MNNNVDNKKLKKMIFIIVSIVVGLVLLTTFIYQLSNRNQYGDVVRIQGIDRAAKGLSKERKDVIMLSLHETILLNTDENFHDKISSIRDVVVRSGSIVQEFGDNNNQIQGSFIVDIASLEQSYIIMYAYSSDPDDGFMSGYPIATSCVNNESLIIYKDFKCKDILSLESGEDGLNSIIQLLPYETLSYRIFSPNDGELLIDMYLSEFDIREGVSKSVNKYKAEILSWIKSNGYNPDDFSITYRY
jgi:hypothetical protein